MTENNNKKYFDLEERTFKFAELIRIFVIKISKNISNIEDIKQLVRSSGSIGANYIEANESLSRKDKLMRIKISRKEAKESVYWLKLLQINNEILEKERQQLVQEAKEITKIFGAIVVKLD